MHFHTSLFHAYNFFLPFLCLAVFFDDSLYEMAVIAVR